MYQMNGQVSTTACGLVQIVLPPPTCVFSNPRSSRPLTPPPPRRASAGLSARVWSGHSGTIGRSSLKKYAAAKALANEVRTATVPWPPTLKRDLRAPRSPQLVGEPIGRKRRQSIDLIL